MDMINLTVKAACVILNVRVDITRLDVVYVLQIAQVECQIPAQAVLNEDVQETALVALLI
jgi:hypothetical protein